MRSDAEKEFESIIAEQLGGQLITDDMRAAAAASIMDHAWIITGKTRQILYTCCDRLTDEFELAGYGIYYGDTIRAGHMTHCPWCSKTVKAGYASRIGRGLVNEDYHIFYRRCANGDLAAIGMWAGKAWGDRLSLMGTVSAASLMRTTLECYATEVVIMSEHARSVRYVHNLSEYMPRYCYYYDGWQKRKGATEKMVGDAIHRRSIGYIRHEDALWHGVLSEQTQRIFANIKKQAKQWQWDYLDLISLAMHKPAVEHLIRLGLSACVWPDYAYERQVINLRGKKPTSILPLTSDELARFKRMPDVQPWMLVIPWFAKKWKQPIKLERGIEAVRTLMGRGNYNGDLLYRFLDTYGERLGLTNVVRYLHRLKTGDELREWMDYLRMLYTVEPDADASMLFPRHLRQAHDDMTVRQKVAKAASSQKKVRERAAKLQAKYTFEYAGMILTPFGEVEEIISEGTKQCICIASYVERYADGGTIICKLRRADAPDTPWHAVEFDNASGRMVQCRGYKNMTYEDDVPAVKAFWKAWDKAHGTNDADHLQIRINAKEDKTA